MASLGIIGDHGTIEGQRRALPHPHTQTHGLLQSHSTTLRKEHIATQVHTYEPPCSLVLPFTTRLQPRALIQAQGTLMVYTKALAHTHSGANRVLSTAHNQTHWHGHTHSYTHLRNHSYQVRGSLTPCAIQDARNRLLHIHAPREGSKALPNKLQRHWEDEV